MLMATGTGCMEELTTSTQRHTQENFHHGKWEASSITVSICYSLHFPSFSLEDNIKNIADRKIWKCQLLEFSLNIQHDIVKIGMITILIKINTYLIFFNLDFGFLRFFLYIFFLQLFFKNKYRLFFYLFIIFRPLP